MPGQSKPQQVGDFGLRAPFAHSQHIAAHVYSRTNANKPLRVMKFGGTSVADASRIQRLAEIITAAARWSDLIVVVSAMSGVTNRLVEAAMSAETGNSGRVAAIFRDLRLQHEQVVDALMLSSAERSRIGLNMCGLFHEGEYLCQVALLAKEVTSQVRDSIASLGERLCAPLVAAAIAERGIRSEALGATELILTDANFGSADPHIHATRERCESRLRPLLRNGIIPVVTGFIGATEEGVLTTLGRGGSDYSATILGAALDADEIIIWTDVNGVLTADPRLVPGACTIPEISYREAADLARFGAKVLHPKTLQPVMQSNIPVWIRNSFAPEQRGTRITPTGVASRGEVKVVTAMSETQLVTLGGVDIAEVRDMRPRATAALSAAGVDAWLTAHSASRNEVSIAVRSPRAEQSVMALLEEFANELAQGKIDRIALGACVAIVTLVGQGLNNVPKIRERSVDALNQAAIEVLAFSLELSDGNLSLAVTPRSLNQTLIVLHQEFRLGELESQVLPVEVL
jgi:bifunctional aspartokinase / homoserine dehydrogenase 1